MHSSPPHARQPRNALFLIAGILLLAVCLLLLTCSREAMGWPLSSHSVSPFSPQTPGQDPC